MYIHVFFNENVSTLKSSVIEGRTLPSIHILVCLEFQLKNTV